MWGVWTLRKGLALQKLTLEVGQDVYHFFSSDSISYRQDEGFVG